MIRFQPFRGFIPVAHAIRDVAVRSTDFATEQENLDEMKANDLAYLHVTKSNLLHPEIPPEDPAYFSNAVKYVQRLIAEGHIVQDPLDTFYLYRQTTYSGTFVGIIGLCDILDYQENRIKKHENTRVDREKWVARLVNETNMVGEPVLLAHPDHPDIEDVIGNTVVKDPEVRFVAKNNSVHEIWRLTGESTEHISEVYEQISAVYIMDGHHRSASFARLYEETGDEKYRYFLGMMLSTFNIRIWPFHRLVKLSHRTAREFFDEVSKVFTLEESEHNWPVLPDHKGTFGLYLEGRWYTMTNGRDRETLDVAQLEQKIFGPILGVKDSRTDKRLEYLRGNHTIEWLQKAADEKDSHVLITLHPCQFEDIQRVSDNDEIMPPKSTYIEPKGRSGMIIHRLDD